MFATVADAVGVRDGVGVIEFVKVTLGVDVIEGDEVNVGPPGVIVFEGVRVGAVGTAVSLIGNTSHSS